MRLSARVGSCGHAWLPASGGRVPTRVSAFLSCTIDKVAGWDASVGTESRRVAADPVGDSRSLFKLESEAGARRVRGECGVLGA